MFRFGFGQFEEDPFFSDHHERMRETFGAFNSFDRHFDQFRNPYALPQTERDRGRDRDRDPRGQRDMTEQRDQRDLAPRDMFGGMFGNMSSMFSNMEQQMARAANDPNSYSYTQSSVMSYSSDGRGEPKYFHAQKATKQAPGGIKETKKAVRDSESGLHRMAIGHHIGDRGQVIERSLNKRTGKEESKQDFINMDEEDAQTFHREWEERTRSRTNALGERHRNGGQRYRAIEEPTHRPEHRRERHRRRDEDERERRVRVQSRPVNRHAPRGGLD